MKTTEFYAFLLVVAGILVSAAWIQSPGAGFTDHFNGSSAWLYVSIVTVGYMISRGLAKGGSREPYDEDAHRS